MAKPPIFISTCSHCNRKTEIEINLLGQQIACRHCGLSFAANDRDNQSAAIDDPVQYWIKFTDHVYSKEEFDLVDGRNIERTPR